jgi:transcription termination factor Rho
MPPRQYAAPQAEMGPPRNPPTETVVEGVLEIYPKGYGFLRNPAKNLAAVNGDAYVSQSMIDRYRLKPGLLISGRTEPSREENSGPRMVSLENIEGKPAREFKDRDFENLTPIDPRTWLRLETGQEPLTTRVMDLLTPIGKGQRGLLVAPPRSGKTVVLQHTALAVAQNNPEMKIIVLLVDERPEEVTEMRRTIKGQVFSSSSDFEPEQHVRIAELVVERAKRLTEQGHDVFLLMDSLTRLARAYNKVGGSSGRTMTGGIDIQALEMPKRLFGSARAFDEGGTLTVMGTALIETGSKMDDIIFQEFKGTGNMEMVLDRKLSDRRVYPALDISQSGTRKEEKILPPDMLKQITLLRRSLVQLNPLSAMMSLVEKLGEKKSNSEFLERVQSFVR